MIARDEEAMIGDCLSSAQPLCDELIVVDTGSRDRTPAIATSAGARVLHLPWNDDFAAARNASIAAATGDWVLVLDADERLTADTPARVRAVLAQAGETFDAGMLRLHDAATLDARHAEVLSGRARLGEPMYLPRLLRRTPDLAYEGVVHESVRAWSARHGHRQLDVQGDIIHLGAVPSHRAARDKGRRNTRLLEKRRAEEPDDFTVHGYLAHEHLSRGDVDVAWRVIEDGWAVFLRSEPSTLRSVLRLTAARALVQLQRGDAEAALATCAATERYEGRQPDVAFFRGRALEMRASQDAAHRAHHLAAAAEAYQDALAQAGRTVAQRYVRGGSTWSAQTRLGTVRLMQDRPAEAAACFEAAMATIPDDTEPALGLVEASIAMGRPPDAPRLRPHVEAERPDAFLLLAVQREAEGDIEGFARSLKRAREASKGGYLAGHRHRLHAAAHLGLLAYRGEPTLGPGVVGAACGLIAGQDPGPRVLDPYEAAALRRLVRNLRLQGRHDWVERLVTPTAEGCLPGLADLVRRVAQ